MSTTEKFATKSRANIVPEVPKRFQAILTQKQCPMYFHGTTSTLREIFNMAYDESHFFARKASQAGRAIVFIGPKDIVETKVGRGNERLSGFGSTHQSAIEFSMQPLE